MKEKFTMGTDPEFMLREKETGKLISSIPYIKGTKYAPEILPCGAGLQRDNVVVEFATLPAGSEAAMVNNVRSAFMDIMTRLPKGHELVADPSACYDTDQLEHPEAQEFGCDPDHDAYEMTINTPPFCGDVTFRSCGGHIHLGYVKGTGYKFLLDPMGKIATVLVMDAVHGIISVIIDCSKAAIKRRDLYGKAGCHRPTEYGVEYRVLSNFWLKSPMLVMLMHRLSSDVLEIIRGGKHEELLDDIGKDNIKEIINDGNVKEATTILEQKIKPLLSSESKEILNQCLSDANKYEMKKEWKLEV